MGDHPTAASYRSLAESFESGQWDAFVDAIADDVEWWEVGASQPIRGKEALLARFQEQMGKWDISVKLHDVLANDDHLVALTEAEGKRGTDTLAYKTVEIHHVNEAGQITHRWSFVDDTGAVLDFFAE